MGLRVFPTGLWTSSEVDFYTSTSRGCGWWTTDSRSLRDLRVLLSPLDLLQGEKNGWFLAMLFLGMKGLSCPGSFSRHSTRQGPESSFYPGSPLSGHPSSCNPDLHNKAP